MEHIFQKKKTLIIFYFILTLKFVLYFYLKKIKKPKNLFVIFHHPRRLGVYERCQILHFVFPHFLTLQTMSIFPDLQIPYPVFVLSLSVSLSLTTGSSFFDDKLAKIFVAGHRGLVDLAIVRKLRHLDFTNFILRTHAELDLTRQSNVEAFFAIEKP